MSDVKDGGPFHPTPNPNWPGQTIDGASLRDWFAGQAIAGLCANPSIHQPNGTTGWQLVNCKMEYIAEYAYGWADAMIAAREGK